MFISNSAEGGTDSTTVTTTNSYGDSGQGWNVITIGSLSTLTFSSTFAAKGRLSYHFVTGSPGSNCFVQWNATQITQSGKTMYARLYCYFPATPANTARFVQFTDASTNLVAGIGTATSKFSIKDSAGTLIQTSTTTIPTNQWIRIEMMVFSDAAVGQVELKIYLTPSSSTADETLTSTATLNTRGTDMTTLTIGNFGSVANYELYADEIALQDTGYIGVNPYISNFRQNNAEGQPAGTTLTRANSGGSSGTPFDLVSFGNSGTTTFSAAQAMHGKQSYLVSCPGSTDSCTFIFNSRIRDTALAMRAYFYFNSLTAANNDLLQILNSSPGFTCRMRLGASGSLFVADSAGTTVKIFGTALTTGVWYRLEMQTVIGTTTSNGVINAQYYFGDSLTPIDSYSSTTANTNTALISDARFGKLTTTGGTMDGYIDDIAVYNGNSFLIGPGSIQASAAWV